MHIRGGFLNRKKGNNPLLYIGVIAKYFDFKMILDAV